MGDNNTSAYNKAISHRLLKIMEIIGLEQSGFSELTKISESHLYALLNGTRNITIETAQRIGVKFKLEASQILNINFEIPTQIKKTSAVIDFYKEHKQNPEYFQETKIERKHSYYIEHTLLPTDLFAKEVYVWQVKEACIKDKKNLSSKEISQKLNYLVQKKKLWSEKRKVKKKNGEDGHRVVLVYRRNNDDNLSAQ